MDAIPEYLQEGQRTEDWYKHRIGKFTGSNIKNLMAKGRGKSEEWGETSKSYVFSKLYERVSDSCIMVPETYQMIKGKDVEEDAVRIFGERTRFYIKPAEFIVSPDVDYVGASPDGLVYDKRDNLVGAFETKCRLDETMLKNAFTPVTRKHDAFWQVQTEMYVTGTKQNFFTHYSPDRKDPFDLQIQVVERDNEAIEEMLDRAKVANSVIEEAISLYGNVYDGRITYITITERMMKMKEYIYDHLI